MASKKPGLSPLPEFASLSAGTTALGEIVVFIDGRVDAAGILEFASALTKEHDARLIGVFMEPGSEAAPAETFARGKGMVSLIEEQQAQLEKIAAKHHAQFEDIVRRHGIRSEWKALPYLSGEVGVHAYNAELVVVARPKSAAPTAGPPGLAESLILSSGRPIILFPPDRAVSQVRRILVAWNATRESVRAVADALPLLVKADAVEVLIVGDERQAMDQSKEPGADVARHLAYHGAHVGVHRIAPDGQEVGRLLLSRAAAFGADLLVMGAYGHSYVSEWMFGGVTRTVFHEAALPVLMSR
jgi:nucleotide-binding universal stress UspA family protein